MDVGFLAGGMGRGQAARCSGAGEEVGAGRIGSVGDERVDLDAYQWARSGVDGYDGSQGTYCQVIVVCKGVHVDCIHGDLGRHDLDAR